MSSKEFKLYHLIMAPKADTNKVDNINILFTELYHHFNDRQIDHVISKLTDHVKWANGMDGGYVYGHEGVKGYWTRQFKIVSSKVTPLEIYTENGRIKIKVHQIVHDVDGKLLANECVYHSFTLENNKIAEFNIEVKEKI